MKKALLKPLSVLICSGAIFGCGGEPENLNTCVGMLGDSIFALSNDEAKYLEELSGESYRQYYVSGAQMEGGFVKTIPNQYADAIEKDGPMRTIVLNGGGNDVLIGGLSECSTDYGTELSAECYDIMDKVLEVSDATLRQAIADGTENIVYQGYYYVGYEALWQVTDVFQERAMQFMAQIDYEFPDVKVVYVDPRDAFFGFDEYIIIDGIHPSEAGSEILANLTWDAMVYNDIEQGVPCE